MKPLDTTDDSGALPAGLLQSKGGFTPAKGGVLHLDSSSRIKGFVVKGFGGVGGEKADRCYELAPTPFVPFDCASL